MAAENAPRGVRLSIAIVGRRNAGKSSLINAIVGQDISIVSDMAGTTTDAVAKPYELLPFGPVTLYDTAGIDDVGEVGALRIKATQKILWRADIALIVVGREGIGEPERQLIADIQKLAIPFALAFNQSDEVNHNINVPYPSLAVSAKTGQNITELKELLIKIIPDSIKNEPPLVADLIHEGDTVLCVVPIDLAAPKGRLILPQVQVLREILDCDAVGMVTKEREIEAAFSGLARKPSLVITDSQVILKVSGDVPEDVPLTTFSTLFARYKGDLRLLVEGARAIDNLKDGDKILVAEACSHHVQADDIGRVKIPRWLSQYTGKNLEYEVYAGHDFPEDLERFALVIHCGSCMLTRMEMIRRLNECSRRGIPVTNYGVAISKLHGVLERVVKPFNL